MNIINFIIFSFLLIYTIDLKANESARERWDEFISDPQHARVVDLAIKTRGQELSDEFTDALSSILTDLSKENSIHEASLLAFQSLREEEEPPTIVEVQGFSDFENRTLRDIVLFFKDSEGNLLMVMKWFWNPHHFLSEISAMEILHNLNLTQSEIVSPLATGRTTYKNAQLYLLVETPAKGETIDKIIMSVINQPEGPERNEAMATASKAIAVQAKALAELHMITSGEENFVAADSLDDIDEIATHLNNMNENLLSIDDLVPQIKDILSDYNAVGHIKRYQLGDPNWTNFLYDTLSSTITMIDVNFMNFTIEPDGSPKQGTAEDYSFVMTDFWYLEKVLSQEEYQLIVKKFDETYRSEILNNGPTDLELTFAMVNISLLYLRGQLAYGDEKSEEFHHFLYQYILKLKQIIQAYQSHLIPDKTDGFNELTVAETREFAYDFRDYRAFR
jgi:hypothetical protein